MSEYGAYQYDVQGKLVPLKKEHFTTSAAIFKPPLAMHNFCKTKFDDKSFEQLTCMKHATIGSSNRACRDRDTCGTQFCITHCTNVTDKEQLMYCQDRCMMSYNAEYTRIDR
jgi:hypothetical protein